MNKILITLLIIFLSGCSSFESRYQTDTKLIIEYLLYDFPLPETTEIKRDQTVVMGTGGNWAGRINIHDDMSPAQLLKYFSKNVVENGWVLSASTVSDQIILVFSKDNRIATVEIFRNSYLKSSNFFQAGTDVTISVHHPNAIGNQKPFEGYVEATPKN
ncbi:MAG: hypothetical protein GJ671_01995 [Alteromonadaceae bacterium]|nr:hypothetical protein [Alteromonadaceae bacterium]